MLARLRDALIVRLTEVAPHLVAGDFGDAVGFWVEHLDFGIDSPLDYRDWRKLDGIKGHVVAEIVADLVDGILPRLEVSLRRNRLRIDPQDGLDCDHGLILTLKSREDGTVEGTPVLVAQYRFEVAGGIYCPEPAPPVPEPAPDEEPGFQETDLEGDNHA